MQFARRLGAYLGAGVPILEALTLLRDDDPGRNAGHVLDSLLQSVSEGKTLTEGLTEFKGDVSIFTLSMIEIGERSGTLSEALSQLSLSLRQQQILKRKLIGTLIYPAIIVVTTASICCFLMLYAFPKILPVLRGFGADLPLATRSLIAFTDMFAHYGPYLLLLIAVIGSSIPFLLRMKRFSLLFDQGLLHIPVFGSLIRSYLLTGISRTLSTLLRNGIGIVPALDLAGSISANRAYAEALGSARKLVLDGEMLSASLAPHRACFPPGYAQMVRTGERSGSLPSSFDMLARQHAEDFEETSDALTGLIEPVLMVVMGLLVGWIAIAIITPVYQITHDIHG